MGAGASRHELCVVRDHGVERPVWKPFNLNFSGPGEAGSLPRVAVDQPVWSERGQGSREAASRHRRGCIQRLPPRVAAVGRVPSFAPGTGGVIGREGADQLRQAVVAPYRGVKVGDDVASAVRSAVSVCEPSVGNGAITRSGSTTSSGETNNSPVRDEAVMCQRRPRKRRRPWSGKGRPVSAGPCCATSRRSQACRRLPEPQGSRGRAAGCRSYRGPCERGLSRQAPRVAVGELGSLRLSFDLRSRRPSPFASEGLAASSTSLRIAGQRSRSMSTSPVGGRQGASPESRLSNGMVRDGDRDHAKRLHDIVGAAPNVCHRGPRLVASQALLQATAASTVGNGPVNFGRP